jgi:hypothetical protein
VNYLPVSDRLFAVSAEEPATVKEATQEMVWRKAMMEELQSIEENRTWKLIDLPSSKHAIGLKLVFKVKKNQNGEVVHHKARLVVKGYAQRHGVDFDNVLHLWQDWKQFGCCLLWQLKRGGRFTTWMSRQPL